VTLPILLTATPPYRDDFEHGALEIRTSPGTMRCAVGIDWRGQPASLRINTGQHRFNIAVYGAWPISDVGPAGIVALLEALSSDAEENDRRDSPYERMLARHAGIALALHEAAHGRVAARPDHPVEVEICMDEDGTPTFWIDIDGTDHPERLKPDHALLALFAGEMRIPCHAWGVQEEDGEVVNVGPSLGEEEGVTVVADVIDGVEMLRIHAALAEGRG
jgi:hypothetical protein